MLVEDAGVDDAIAIDFVGGEEAECSKLEKSELNKIQVR
jgi:hypothetical protein